MMQPPVSCGEDKEAAMEPKHRDLKKEIKAERLKKRTEPMWFYDEADELWQTFRKETQPLEREYLEIRALLRDAEIALRAEPENEHLTARVKYLRKRLEELEKKAPWIAADTPWEVLLWGVPHG
jgi:DNA-binding transcriptional regulator GbsR (MarR family)